MQKQKLNEQKSPQGEKERQGKVWILSQEKKPVPVSVVLGITDGTFSEVVAGEIREGMEVIVEETTAKKGQSSPPPFMRGMGR